MVKLAMLATGNVRDQPIEDGTVLLILVQPQVQEVAQEPSALGNAEAVGILQVSNAGIALPSAAVLEEGPHITRGEQATPDNRCSGGAIDYLVDLAGHEPRGHVHVRGVGHDTAIFQPRKRPLLAWNDAL